MDTKIEQLLDYIKISSLDEEDKSFLVSRLSDETISQEEKEKLVSEFLTTRKTEISSRSQESLVALREAEEEIAQAEKEYDQAMAELNKEAEELSKSSGEEMNLVVPEG